MTTPDATPEHDDEAPVNWIQTELAEAQKTIRMLMRQVSKEEARNEELIRAHGLTIANLRELTRENKQLARERERWRRQVDGGGTRPFVANGAAIDMSPAEISAIRKAMARLHHPDVGGDAERMKLWNSVLDPLENE